VVSRYVIAIAAAAAAGIVAAIVLYGDIPYRMQDGKEITIVGPIVCLPHKQGLFGGAATEECAFGFRGQDGRHFALYNYGEIEEQNPWMSDERETGHELIVTGIFHYGGSEGYEKYDIAGMIDADRVDLAPRISQ